MLPVSAALPSRAEQRKFTRRPVWLRCWVLDDIVRRYARVAELSEGGARIMTALPPAAGSTLKVFLELRGAAELWVPSKVVWSASGFAGRGGVMGVAFDVIGLPAELIDAAVRID